MAAPFGCFGGRPCRNRRTASAAAGRGRRGQKRFEEAKGLLRKTIPAARRVVGESHELTLRIRWSYAGTLYEDNAATLDDLREAVTTLEDTERIARRVLGGAHPTAVRIEQALRAVRQRQEALK